MKQIETCKVCKKRDFNSQVGIICGLTNSKPTFESTCPNFDKDENEVNIEKSIVKEYLPNEKWAKRLLFIFGLYIAFQILEVTSNYMQYNLIQPALEGNVIDPIAAENNDTRHLLIVVLSILTYLLSAIFFTVWFYRAYQNLHFRVDHCQYKKNWAIWGWIVPIGSLFIPYKIMQEIYIDTKAKLVSISEDYSKINLSMLIGFWWASWLVAIISQNIISKLFDDEESLQGIIDYTIGDIVAGILFLISALITFKLIKEISQLDEKLRAYELDKIRE